MITWGVQSHSQNHTGGGKKPEHQNLNFDGVPQDQFSDYIQDLKSLSNDEDRSVEHKTPHHKAEQQLKSVSFIEISTRISKMVREMNQNIEIHCKEKKPNFTGFKDALQYLLSRQLRDVSQINPVNFQCKPGTFNCVFQGNTANTLKSLVQSPYFADYLVERRKWRKTDALSAHRYLEQIGESLVEK